MVIITQMMVFCRCYALCSG